MIKSILIVVSIAVFIALVIFIVNYISKRKRAIPFVPIVEDETPIDEIPIIHNIDWVARNAFISLSGIEYIYSFKVANTAIDVGKYKIYSSNDGLCIYIGHGDLIIRTIKNPKY